MKCYTRFSWGFVEHVEHAGEYENAGCANIGKRKPPAVRQGAGKNRWIACGVQGLFHFFGGSNLLESILMTRDAFGVVTCRHGEAGDFVTLTVLAVHGGKTGRLSAIPVMEPWLFGVRGRHVHRVRMFFDTFTQGFRDVQGDACVVDDFPSFSADVDFGDGWLYAHGILDFGDFVPRGTFARCAIRG